MLRHNKNIDDFEEFWKDEKYQDGYSYHGAKIAWNYQQQKIDRLQESKNLYYISDRCLSLILDGLAFYQADIDEFKEIEGNIETFNAIDKLMSTLNKDFNKQNKEN